jgi:hypothetical protein
MVNSYYSDYKIIDIGNESIIYSNLYIKNNKITYISDKPVQLPYVNKFLNNYPWRPEVEFTDNINYHEFIDLAVLNDNVWYGNIGHAFWDGLYPIYVSLCKFGLENEKFDYFTTEMDNTQTLSYNPISKFCGGTIWNYQNLPNKIIKINRLVVGVGSCGNVVMRNDYKLYGNKWKSLEKFRNRMYSVYNIKLQPNLGEIPNIIFINNKRYSNYETEVIEKILNEFKFIKWIDFYNINGFEKHLQLFSNVDIQITGPGTGMMYLPFLKNGAVNINLGYMEYPQKNTARPNIKIENYHNDNWCFPGYMEQSVCNAVEWVTTLYYDRYENNELEYNSLKDIILKSITIWESKKHNNNNNLNIDAQIFVEYCRRDKNFQKICDHLTNKSLFIELLINEHPHAINEWVNLDLLRKIKDEFGYNRNYEFLN